jgi:glycosyltransferase involved in cell wall biosynthesis
VGELETALRALITDAELRRRLGDGARTRVAERFSTERVLAQVGALYEALGVVPGDTP